MLNSESWLSLACQLAIYIALKLEIWDFVSSSPFDYFPLALSEPGSSPWSISMVSDVFLFFHKRRDVLDWNMKNGLISYHVDLLEHSSTIGFKSCLCSFIYGLQGSYFHAPACGKSKLFKILSTIFMMLLGLTTNRPTSRKVECHSYIFRCEM